MTRQPITDKFGNVLLNTTIDVTAETKSSARPPDAAELVHVHLIRYPEKDVSFRIDAAGLHVCRAKQQLLITRDESLDVAHARLREWLDEIEAWLAGEAKDAPGPDGTQVI